MRTFFLFILGFVLFYLLLHFFNGFKILQKDYDKKETVNHPGLVYRFAGIDLYLSKNNFVDTSYKTLSYSFVYKNFDAFGSNSDNYYVKKNNEKYKVNTDLETGSPILPINAKQYEFTKYFMFIIEALFQLILLIISYYMFRIIYNIKSNPFSKDNLSYMSKASFFILILGIITFFQNGLVYLYVRLLLNYSVPLFKSTIYDIIPHTFIIGLFFYFVLQIYRKGIEFHHEQTMTI